MSFNPSQLTLGEVATVESLAGASIDQLADDATPKGLMLAALAYVIKRREIPEYTFNEAQALTLGEAEALISFDDDDEDETPNLPVPQDHLPSRKHA